MRVLIFTSSFCSPCHRALEVFAEVKRLVPSVEVTELNVAQHSQQALDFDVRSTPTVIVQSEDGTVAFRSEGVPTVPQALAAVAHALPLS